MAAPADDIQKLKQQLAIQNLERLSRYNLPTTPPKGSPNDNPCGIGLKILEAWSDKNKESIQKSISRQAFGRKDVIDWSIAFLPFMESAGVYLRDWGNVLKAVEIYREYKEGESNDSKKLNAALSLYEAAYHDIQALAQYWNMDFIAICDLIDDSPSGHLDWDGPYCGAFFTTDAQKDHPFIGLAFKGTHPFNDKELAVDYNYDLTTPDGYLQNQQGTVQVSVGVYTGLFGNFEAPYNPPYAYIVDQVGQLAKNLPNPPGGAVRTHVTGHSLGGSYSSFCFAQLLLDEGQGKLSRFIATGDEYTFGAPRVGSEDWAKLNRDLHLRQAGSIWRIVHDQDVVPQVPATSLKPTQVDFYHMDGGMQIFDDAPPVAIPTEIGGPPPPPYNIESWDDFITFVLQVSDHSKCTRPSPRVRS